MTILFKYFFYRELPKAVQEKYSCLVSKGNKNGYMLVKTSLHVGRALLANTNGSWKARKLDKKLERAWTSERGKLGSIADRTDHHL